MSQKTKGLLVVAAFILALFVIVWGLGDALLPLMISFGAAYLVFPIIQRLEKRGIHRNHAVFGIFAVFLLGFIASVVLIVPGLVSDAKDFISQLPALTVRALERIEVLAASFGYPLDLSQEQIRVYIVEHASEFSSGLLRSFSQGLVLAFSGVTIWLLSILNFFLIPLFFFYVINDYEKILAGAKSFVPRSIEPQLNHYLELSNQVLSGYIRGQIIVALVLACLYSTGLWLVGLKFGILIGFASGILNIIPYAGFTIGFATALLMGFANYDGMGPILGIVAVYVIVQSLESTIITPKLVGNKVGLSALATMLALIVGGNLFGLVGMLMAIPVAAALKFIMQDMKTELHQLEMYK